MTTRTCRWSNVVVALFLSVASLGAESIVFPSDANIRDITKPPYNAKNDGSEDARPAIIKALTDSLDGTNLSRLRNLIIYFPNGTYLISDSITWGTDGISRPFNAIIMQGQSRDGTILKIGDNNQNFIAKRNAIFTTGFAPAQRFRNAVRNMTINTGRGNTQACGVRFNASNFGIMSDVKIVSEDGIGFAGIDMSFTNEIGPLLIRNVEVSGYDYGILTSSNINSQTYENITLSGQKKTGFHNLGQVVSIRKLTSTNSVPALFSSGGSLTVLLDATLTGSAGADTAGAIVNADKSGLYVRNVAVSGYANAINSAVVGRSAKVPGPRVTEWVSHAVNSLFESPAASLGLPIEETPEVPWESDLSQWANVCAYGAKPGDNIDDAEAIQAAIDAGKTTVYFPRGSYIIGGGKTIEVRGKVNRIVGCEASVSKRLLADNLTPAFRVSDGAGLPAIVSFERIEGGAGSKEAFFETRATGRTLVIRSCSGKIDSYGGKVFIEDVTSSDCYFKDSKVWARQLNIENAWFESETRSKIYNDRSDVWILGYKTERDGNLIRTANGGKTELLGGFSYSTLDPKMTPMFVNELSSFSAIFTEVAGRGVYDTLVVESRECTETVRYFTRKSPGWIVRGSGSGSMLVLYTGYCATAGCGCGKASVNDAARPAVVNAGLPQTMVRFDPNVSQSVTIPAGKKGFEMFDLRGCRIWNYRREHAGTAESVVYPRRLGTGVRTVTYVD